MAPVAPRAPLPPGNPAIPMGPFPPLKPLSPYIIIKEYNELNVRILKVTSKIKREVLKKDFTETSWKSS